MSQHHWSIIRFDKWKDDTGNLDVFQKNVIFLTTDSF